jgi:hypothetical protein
MPELDDAALERRLRGVLKEHLGALPLDLTVDALDRRREAKWVARRSGRGRSITLLAAAALLLVGGALAAGSGVLRLPSIVPPVPAPSFGVVPTASRQATSPNASDLAGPTQSAVPGPAGVWIATGTMGTPRDSHTAVRLVDGRVLVAGGSGANQKSDLTSAELYDPGSGTWSATRNMLKPLGHFPATLLRDGKVLVADVEDPADDSTNGAEVYDPEGGTWTATGKMVKGAGDTATLLRDGKVLVAGFNGAQLYDPDSGTWSTTGKMTTPRSGHTATLLSNGKVLVTGGYVVPDRATDSAELYDPDTGSWTATANTPGGAVTATLLQDGRVLVTGRLPALYDSATGTWTPTGDMARPGTPYQTATLLSDGMVLVAGGGNRSDAAEPPFTAAELYDPAAGSWITTGTMLRWHNGSSTTPLLDGTVLVAGGFDCAEGATSCPTGATGSAELYVPAGVSPPPGLGPFPSPIATPTPIPTPIPTPFPTKAGPVPSDARSWKVTVVNKNSEPATLFLAEEGENGIGQLCGNVTPNVVPAGVTEKVTFLLPPKRVKSCWIWVEAVPGGAGSLFQTSDAPLAGHFLIMEGGEEGAQGGWVSP